MERRGEKGYNSFVLLSALSLLPFVKIARWFSVLQELRGGEGKSEPVRDGWVNSNLLSSLMV